MKHFHLNINYESLENFKLTFVILFGLFFSNFLSAQEENEVIAKVGADEITVEEYQNRYEFMPHLNYSVNNADTIKKEFLYSLIAEKLWSLEGSQKRFDTLESVKYSLESLRRLLIKDELYKTEIEPKIKIANEEIGIGLQRVTLELYVKIISTEDSLEIQKISDQLTNGADFDSVLSTRSENILQKEPVRIIYGSLDDEKVENLLFGMKPGSISLPIKSGTGWFIFKLENQNHNPAVSLSNDQAKNIVTKVLTDRKIQEFGGVYLDSLIGGRSIEADKNVFLKIFDALHSVLSDEYPGNLNDSSFFVTLSEKQILQTINLMNHDDLMSPFIKFENGSATAKDFFYYMYYQKIDFENLSKKQIAKTLNTVVRQFIEDEMLVREGIKRGLQNNIDVRNGVMMWREYYTAQMMMETFYDSVNISDEQIRSYFNSKNTDSTAVYTDSLQYITSLKEQLELEKLDEVITRKTIEYANKYSFKINEQILENLELSELNTFTYKLIGFGGKIAAFPITIPMYEWYYLLKAEKTSLP